jgi:DNA-binding NarL/FixJ family response regulator
MRIVIADDSALVRRGVMRVLSSEPDWVVCGQASNGAETLEMCSAMRPDLVLLDVNMPGASGLETSRLLRRELPDIRILIMSHHDPVQLLPGVLKAGADGCLDKASIATQLIDAIRNISQPAGAPGAANPHKSNRSKCSGR